MSVIKLPVSTFELTFVAVILGRSMTYDVLHERFPSNGYQVAHRIAIGSPSVCMSIFQPLMLGFDFTKVKLDRYFLFKLELNLGQKYSIKCLLNFKVLTSSWRGQ